MKATIIAILVALFVFSAYKTYTAKSIDDIRQAERQQLMTIAPQKLDALKLAVKNNDRIAQYELGLIYARGADLVPQDYAKARDLLFKASMQGVPQAQYHLGEMYVWGDGVEVDYAEATVWFWLATSLGDRYSQKRLRAINTRISNQELADAKVKVDHLWKEIPHDLKIEKKSLH